MKIVSNANLITDSKLIPSYDFSLVSCCSTFAFLCFYIATNGTLTLPQRLQLLSASIGPQHWTLFFFFSNRTISGPVDRFVMGHDSRRTTELSRFLRQWIRPFRRSRGVHFHIWPCYAPRNQGAFPRKLVHIQDYRFCDPRWTSHVQGELKQV